MNFKISTASFFLRVAIPLLIASFLFYGCQKENDELPEPQNNPPVISISANPREGEVPLESIIKVDGTDEDGKSDIAKYSLEIKELGIDFDKKNPIDTTITFTNPGEYTVNGEVSDKMGDIGKEEMKIYVDKTPNASVSQNVSLEDYVRLNYNVDFSNTDAIQLDVVKDGEKILSKNITNSEYSEIFSYSSDDKITKGNYEFVANFKNSEGKDTNIVSSVEIPNYNPKVDWSNLDINFNENSSKTITLPNPTDKNPEDNPVNYIPESFSSNKANLDFNSEDNLLKIIGTEDVFGNYNISSEFGNSEGGISSVSKNGTIYELARLKGIIESNESHEGIKATIVPYEVIGNDTLKLFSNSSDEQGRKVTNNYGEFEMEFDKKVSDLEDVLLMARQGTPENYEGWVRVQNIPKENLKNVLVRTVPYEPYENRKDEFKSFVLETTRFSNPFPYLGVRFDFDGSILGGLPEFENYKGLERIRILDEDPYTGGTFTEEEQEVFKQKLLDKENINGIIGNYEIKPEQIVFGNDGTHEDYVWLEQEGSGFVKASNGVIVVVPIRDLPYTGLANYAGSGPIITGGVVYLKAGDYNDSTFPHEMGHLFISANHPESLYGETIMSSPIPGWMDYTRPGPADKKLGSIVYENSYLVKPENLSFKRPDYIKNILRDDFK